MSANFFRASYNDAKAYGQSQLSVPAEFTRFERTLPFKIRVSIIMAKLHRAFSVFGFWNEFEEIDIESDKAKSILYNACLEKAANRVTNAVAKRTELLDIEHEIARTTEQLEQMYEQLNTMNVVYRRSPPPDLYDGSGYDDTDDHNA